MLYVNSSTRKFIPIPGNNSESPVKNRPTLLYGEKYLLRIQFCDDDGAPAVFADNSAFDCAVDLDFNHDTVPMCYSGNERCVVEENGIIQITLVTHTAEFAQRGGELSSPKNAVMQIRCFKPGENLPVTILQDSLAVMGSVLDVDNEPPEESNVNYYSAAQMDALLTGKAAQTDLDALDTRMDNAETALGNKASASDVTALSTRVTAAETALTNKAESTSVTALTTRVETLENASLDSAAVLEIVDAGGYTTDAEVSQAVAGKADLTDVTAIDTRLTAAEAVGRGFDPRPGRHFRG